METLIKYKYHLILTIILILALFLRIDRLNELMVFFPDQGIFYLPAKDMLTNGTIPLVGPETSHPWIRHGPHWIYTLGVIFWLFNFNPVAPAYFIAVLGVITVLLFYLTVKSMFGRNIGLLASILFATSPLIVTVARLPYHISPLPFFVILLYYFTYKLVKGSKWSLPVITLLLGILYNHEITTFVYFITIFLILFYGIIKKEFWFKKLLDIKIILVSSISFLIPMTPFILYDIGNGHFNQTLRFLTWVGYRVIKFPLSLVSEKYVSPSSGASTYGEFFSFYKLLIFATSEIISLLILILSFYFVIIIIYKSTKKRKKSRIRYNLNIPLELGLLFTFLGVSTVGLLIHRVPIEADILLISPFIVLLTTLSLVWLTKNKIFYTGLFIIFIAFTNVVFLLSTNYATKFSDKERMVISKKIEASEKIIKIVDDKPYNLVGRGALSHFPSFTMPYEYLLWWMGNPPSVEDEELKILIWQDKNNIIVKSLK